MPGPSARMPHPSSTATNLPGRTLAALAVLALLLPAHAQADGITPLQLATLRHAVSELVRKEMKDKDIEALSVALVEDQQLLWSEGFGVADVARGIPAQADTLYAVGGLSQLFTATAVMQLTERGTLNLDQPVTKVLPEFSIRSRFANAPPITPRLLLAHRSGLPGMHFKNMWTPTPEPLASFVARLKNEYTAYPPGQIFSPSFPGYDVLGRIVETQCRQPFAACLQERVLAPLGMKHSTFDIARADRTRFATHYWNNKPYATQAVRDIPAAGLASSVNDLARFMHMIFANGKLDGRQILSARSVAEMLRAQNERAPLDLDNHVGMPWRLAGVRFPQARTVAWLNNDSPFSRGRVLVVPEHKLGVVVLTNCAGSTESMEKISERLMELALQTRKRTAPEPRPAALTAVPPPRREDFSGQYATILGLISVKPAGNRYRAQMIGKTIELMPQPTGLYAPEYRFLGLIPIPLSVLKEVRVTTATIDGRPFAIAYYRNQAYRLGEKISTHKLSDAWRRRLGDYRAAEHDPLLDLIDLHNVALAYDDDLLHLRYRVKGWLGIVANVPVRPVSDTELVVDGTGWLMGETISVVQRDGVEMLRYSGYEFRKIRRP